MGNVFSIRVVVTKNAENDGYPIGMYLQKAREVLFQHNLYLFDITTKPNSFAKTIDWSADYLETPDDVRALRKAVGEQDPGASSILRVIVTRIWPPKLRTVPAYGITYSDVKIDGNPVPPFVLLDSNSVCPSHATLIHEMIHAGTNLQDRDHDVEDQTSVFAGCNASQNYLRPIHAQMLVARAFFGKG